MSTLSDLSHTTLINLANALENQRLFLDASIGAIARYVTGSESEIVAAEFKKFRSLEMTEKATSYTIQLIAKEQKKYQDYQNNIEVVWTIPDLLGNRSRGTALIVQDLFQKVKNQILISTYVLDKPEKSLKIFELLAQRMEQNPDLQARIILNIERPYKSNIATSVLLREFAENFRHNIWHYTRLPEVFYDGRSLSEDETYTRSCLHAKFIIVDQSQVFLTSANFTEAAHQRNIEAGLLLQDEIIASNILNQVNLLIKEKILIKVPGI